eukprot:snap_masked-scaffold_65-processed-gene-0.7-mRNA-1 protein AED:1.00 eAED:1.00 QI:0/0/0/0/1/1/3/0/73
MVFNFVFDYFPNNSRYWDEVLFFLNLNLCTTFINTRQDLKRISPNHRTSEFRYRNGLVSNFMDCIPFARSSEL